MPAKRLTFRILLIDDDEAMLDRLENLLSGHRVCLCDIEVVSVVDRIDVALVRDQRLSNRWVISEATLAHLSALSHGSEHNLIMTDFSLTSSEVKELLWNGEPALAADGVKPRDMLLTVRDLRTQFEAWRTKHSHGRRRKNVFISAKRVILRSFVHRHEFDVLGPLVPDRLLVTQSAFPNATIIPFDTRQDLYANDTFYQFYTADGGREFYRQIVGTYYLRLVETEILRFLTNHPDAPGVSERKAAAPGTAFTQLEQLAKGFHEFAKALLTRHGGRPPIAIRDEYDVQDIFAAFLRIFFEDVRREEWIPSLAGGSTRTDIYLKKEKVFVELKMARAGVSASELRHQIADDILVYPQHPRCKAVFFFIYDPEGHLMNPRGIERDLNETRSAVDVKVVISP